jgi:diaminohydroxyphosphoribosylaminopyrimidine deaminase/5-amino-6-(5-phosphoribosylamino)uracil reductase
MKDPNPLVSGKGIRKLVCNGIKVKCGVLENEARELNKVFVKNIITGLPYVMIKSAVSVDGKIAAKTGDSKWISSDQSRKYVHDLRAGVDAILVGINTVLKDNPVLTAHGIGKDPIRIIVDPELKVPLKTNIVKHDPANTVVVVSENVRKKQGSKINRLIKTGARVLFVKQNLRGNMDFRTIMNQLVSQLHVYSVLVEGGGETNWSAIKSGVVDELILFIAPKIIGGRDAKTSVEGDGISKISNAISLQHVITENIGQDLMVRYKLCLRG